MTENLDHSETSSQVKKFRDILDYHGVEITPSAVKILTNEILESFEKGIPLQYIHSNSHLGDHFILMSAFSIVLLKFLEKHGLIQQNLSLIEKNIIIQKYLSLSHHPNNGMEFKNNFQRWGRNKYVYESALNDFYISSIFWIADHLGVELSEEMVTCPPIPFTSDFEGSPMKNFDWEKVFYYINKFEELLDPNKTYCILLHGGRLPSKRFSRKQVREIKEILKSEFPRAGYIILTAQEIDKNGDDPLVAGDADLVVNAVEDINQTVALFLAASNETYITTDTFLAWLGSGSIALRADRNGKLRERDVYALYTIASSQFWNIPGANEFESKAIKHLREIEGRFGGAADNIMYEEEYKEFYEEEIDHVASEDIEGFLVYIIRDNRKD